VSDVLTEGGSNCVSDILTEGGSNCLLFSGVHSGHLHSSEDTQVPDEGAKPEGSIMLEGQGAEDYIEVGEPSEFYLQEVREQVEAQRTAEETQTKRDTRSTCSNPSESN